MINTLFLIICLMQYRHIFQKVTNSHFKRLKNQINDLNILITHVWPGLFWILSKNKSDPLSHLHKASFFIECIILLFIVTNWALLIAVYFILEHVNLIKSELRKACEIWWAFVLNLVEFLHESPRNWYVVSWPVL